MSRAELRLLNDGAMAAAINMARDETLLERVGRRASPATLRLYEWSAPTISLGYFQPYSQFQALQMPASRFDVVRRQTGGGAILHDRELTYSIVLPNDHPLIKSKPTVLYQLAHRALINCLGALGVEAHCGGRDDGSGAAKGPFFCFARRHRYDVLIGSEKLAGSAQRRTAKAVLQHGSIIVERRFSQQPAASLASFGVDVDQLRLRFPLAVARVLNVAIEEGTWSTPELEMAANLEPKYASDDWMRRR